MKTIAIILLLAGFHNQSFSQSQMELNRNAAIEFEKSDAKLNSIYKKVMASLETQVQKNDLLAAQRAWIKYKESHCNAFANQYEGGSINSMIYSICLKEVTDERIVQLNRYNEH
jgi:uncharacterized protein YecT (DUF1311 family)